MTAGRTLVSMILATTFAVVACAPRSNEPTRSPGPDRRIDGRHAGGPLTSPPPVTIHFGDRSLELEPWSFCYDTGCADGVPPEPPPNVGSPKEIYIEYPLAEWRFSATFEPAGEPCPRQQETRLHPTEEGRWLLRPVGYADTYHVHLWGRGDGDASFSFRWTTREDGPRPKPTARLALIADNDGDYDSYGVELVLSNLAQTPRRASATITTTAANDESLSFRAKRGHRCWAEGTAYWQGPDRLGKRAATLGEAPFRYAVEVILDGERYRAHATWPDDEITGNEPSVRLRFEPDLPALP